MTAPDHFAKTELNPFAGEGRPHMISARTQDNDGIHHADPTKDTARVSVTTVCSVRLPSEQSVKLPGLIERLQVIRAADMGLPDEDLRNGPTATATGNHCVRRSGVLVNINLSERDALLA
jgi:hypothetical protein